MLVSFYLPGNRAHPPPALRGAGHSTHTGEDEPLFDPVRLECGRMSNASKMCFLHIHITDNDQHSSNTMLLFIMALLILPHSSRTGAGCM